MKKPPPPFDIEATNPRYGTAKMSDLARVLLRPKNPAAQAALDRLQGRTASPEKEPPK